MIIMVNKGVTKEKKKSSPIIIETRTFFKKFFLLSIK